MQQFSHASSAAGTTGMVVISGGWSGEAVLARLLASSGAVRVAGRPLRRSQHDPVAVLHELLTVRVWPGERASVGFVHPDDLWLTNGLDPVAAVAALVDSGLLVACLSRSSDLDTGLSRAVCGDEAEYVPHGTSTAHAETVVGFAHWARYARTWCDGLDRVAARITFENDLAEGAARQDVAVRLADLLEIESWEPPAEPRTPDHERLWAAVENRSTLAETLPELARTGGWS